MPPAMLCEFVTLSAQPVDYVRAANSVMAKDDQGCIVRDLIEAVEMMGDRIHRYQFGPLDSRDLVFVRPAYVDQGYRLAGFEFSSHFCGSNFKSDRVGHHPILPFLKLGTNVKNL
jgi:hypothetical protein